MSDKQSFDFVKSMSQYGVILGCLVGFFGTIPFTLTWFDLSRILPVLAVILTIGMCGGLVGLVYGGASGYISGWLIKIITGWLFQDIKQQHIYKLTLGIISVGVTITVLLVGHSCFDINQEQVFARSISLADLQVVEFMSLLFAVYASQRVATQYLRDLGFSKEPKIK